MHRVLVCSQLAPVLPLGRCMSMWVVAHTVAVALYCFSLCVAVFFTVLQLFTVRRLSHYLFILSLIFDKRTVVFTLYVCDGLFSHSVVSSRMYITTVCVGSCLAGKGCGGPNLGWVSVCLSAGRVLVGAGWDFMGGGVYEASIVLLVVC